MAAEVQDRHAQFTIGFDRRDRERVLAIWDSILEGQQWSEGEWTRRFEEAWAAWKLSKDMQRSSRLQSTNATLAPACSAASGVAMNVFDGQSTVSPRTPANSSAASAAPDHEPNAIASSPFHAAQVASKRRFQSDHASSNRRVHSPSVHS